MEEEDARRVLEGAGLQIEVMGEANHPTIPVFAIIEQEVRAGEPVAEGTTIGVVISQGPELIEVPPLIGQTLDEAQAQVQSVGLIAQIQEAWSEQTPGTVIDQDPPPGSLVSSRSLISLTASSGTQAPVGATLGDRILLAGYELPPTGEVARLDSYESAIETAAAIPNSVMAWIPEDAFDRKAATEGAAARTSAVNSAVAPSG